MTQSNPLAIVMQYMQGGDDITTALGKAAQQHPDLFPRERVDVALSVLAKDSNAQRRVVSNMAREQGIDLNDCLGRVENMARAAGLKFNR